MFLTSTFMFLLTAMLNLQVGAYRYCDKGRTYIIVPGDTCDSICTSQGVSNFQLLWTNPLINANCDNLEQGQMLCLGIHSQDCTETHNVTAVDTCTSIATVEGVDLGIFMGNNGNLLEDCTNLSPGNVVCVTARDMDYACPVLDLPWVTQNAVPEQLRVAMKVQAPVTKNIV